MKVLVTGANGYLGQGIVKALLDDGIEVIATDFTLQNVDNRAIKRNCDLFEVDNPYDYFYKPDVVLHLAWRDGFIHNSDAHFNDFLKHFNFIKNIATSKVKQIAVMGSMHEIGFFEGSIDENTSCNPDNFYGIAKNALRNATKILAKENKKIFQWLRGFYIVGNIKTGYSIFSKIARASGEGRKEFPFTMGLNQYDFLDYNDFCQQVAAVVEQSELQGIINICNGRPEKLADRVERFIKDNNYDIKLQYGVFPDRPYDSKAVWGNNEKIQRIIAAKEIIKNNENKNRKKCWRY